MLMSIILLSFGACNDSNNSLGTKKYKARFEVAGMCSNYTFRVIGGDIDPALVEQSWTHPDTKKTYKNAFTVKNPCILPHELKEGDTFDFIIDTNPPKSECVVCMAYYPTPDKKLDIKVVK